MTRPVRWSSLNARIQDASRHNRSLLTNAGSMVGTTLVTSVLGVAFWLIAAHNFSQPAVGVASAAVAAMLLLGSIGTLGMGTLLMGEFPRRGDHHRSLLNAALLVNVLTGSILGLAFALLAPLISPNLGPLSESPASIAFFAAGVDLTALVIVLDQALIGLLRGRLRLTRDTVFALAGCSPWSPIAVFVRRWRTLICSAWAGSITLSLILLARFYARRNGTRCDRLSSC